MVSSYEVHNVQIGLLNFTVLVLFPPPVPLTYTTATENSVAGVNVCLIEFTPTVAALDVYNTNPGEAPITNVFTTTNRARMSVTPDCLSTLDCVIYPQLVEVFRGLNAYTILPSKALPPIEAGDYFVQWVVAHIGFGPMPLGSNITIIEPLQLVLLSS